MHYGMHTEQGPKGTENVQNAISKRTVPLVVQLNHALKTA